jgi:ATP-dependent DNA helicase DinG
MSNRKLTDIFAPEGALAKHIPNFRSRPQQVEMATAISEAIAANSLLIAEAGTGTGKTFAYLVPALLAGGKVVLSTGTKNLQDQLFQRDLPTVRDALKVPVTIALLKGRANYLCHYHLERAQSDGRLPTREDVRHLARIVQYAKITQTGDKSGLADVPENAQIWMHVTSTRDNCLGQECPSHKECFVLKARKEAMEADVVVVNHHLFFADVMLRDEGVAELLPACNTVIFDEAHQLPETASLFFGENISTSQLLDLARDATIEALSGAKDFTPLPAACDTLEKAARDLRLIFKKNEGRMTAEATGELSGWSDALNNVATQLGNLNGLLEKQAERSEGLENCWQRGVDLAQKLMKWRDDTQLDVVRWVEIFHHSMQLNTTPLSIAEIFARQIGGTPRAGTARLITPSRRFYTCRKTCPTPTAWPIPKR